MAKTPAKKTAVKKVAAKKASTAAKKTSAKTAAPKKVAVKKTAAKKTAVKKTAAKKTSKAVVEIEEKKVAAKKRPAKRISQMEDGMALALLVAQGMYEKKAENIKILDMRAIPTASADYFVISHAASDKQVEAIADSAEDFVQKSINEWPWHTEGYENCEWILLDYIDVVAHVFKEDLREFYGLEELWGDAVEVPFKGK